ncbi:MAG TPA: glycosyltransferase family 39 protein [bacterium]|nr:glycosyltransferase family 39 protein [bacterium]
MRIRFSYSHIPEKFNSFSDRSVFIFIFLIALIFRTYAALTSIAPIHPDEIFQTVEMAHKAAFGKGFVFWEFNVGARSWFLPGVFAGIYKILDFLGVKDPFYLNAGLKITLGFFHSFAVSVVYLLFRKYFRDRFTAFFFTLSLAFSYILSYISARTLSESAALPFMVFAVYQSVKYVENYKYRHLVYSVFLSGIAFMIRFQTASFTLGLAIAFLFVSRKHIKTSLIFGFGYLGMILVQGVLDELTWGKFMQSFLTYFDYNVLRGVANKHGVEPWYFYIKQIAANFNPAIYLSAALFAVTVIFSFKKNQLEFLFSFPFLFFLFVHAVISHKEPRFIFPFYFFILTASSASFAFIYEKYFRNRFLIAVLFLLIIMAAYTSSLVRFSENWNSSVAWYEYWGNDKGFDKRFKGNIELSIQMGRIQNLKSADVYGIPKLWSGGYAYFHKNAPITYTVEKNEMLNSLKSNRNSGNTGAFFAFKKGSFEPFKDFGDVLKPVQGTDEFDIYEMISTDKTIQVKYSELPKKTNPGSLWNASGNIVMGKSGVTVNFSKTEKASKLKIALDSSDSYDIYFKNDSEITGHVTLQSHKNKRGMFIHEIDMTGIINKLNFNTIEIKPAKGDGYYSLGNIRIINQADTF